MSRLVLVRHGKAAAGWGDDPDPGLDDVGRAQAEGAADALAPLGARRLVVSPLRRTRETAEPLAARWGVTPHVERGVGEVVAPSEDLAARSAWLREAMAGRWSDLGPTERAWRDLVLATLRGIAADGGDRGANDEPVAVVVSHFVAINVAVGAALGDDRVVCFRPDHCSRTTVEVDADGGFHLVELGGQAATEVR